MEEKQSMSKPFKTSARAVINVTINNNDYAKIYAKTMSKPFFSLKVEKTIVNYGKRLTKL